MFFQHSWCDKSSRIHKSPTITQIPPVFSSATIRHGIGTSLTPISPVTSLGEAGCIGNCSDDNNLTSPKKIKTTQKSPSVSSIQSKELNIEKKEVTKNKEGKKSKTILFYK